MAKVSSDLIGTTVNHLNYLHADDINIIIGNIIMVSFVLASLSPHAINI